MRLSLGALAYSMLFDFARWSFQALDRLGTHVSRQGYSTKGYGGRFGRTIATASAGYSSIHLQPQVITLKRLTSLSLALLTSVRFLTRLYKHFVMASNKYLVYGLTSPEGSKWTWDEFEKDYKEHDMPTALTVPGNNNGLRYKNTDPKAEWPHLALYTPTDMAELASPVLQELVRESQEARIKVAVRIFEKLQDFEGHGEATGNHGKFVVIVQIEPKPGMDDAIDEWYREEHLDLLSTVRGYRRSTRWKLLPDAKGEAENVKLPESQAKFFATFNDS